MIKSWFITGCICLLAFNLSAQSDSLLFNFYQMKNGEVFVGLVSNASDTGLVITEHNLGKINLNLKSIERVEPVYKGKLVKIYLADNSVYRGRILEISPSD
jgi:hypothetical protein